ncbi:hypothetical protein AVEN_70269-1 [Araneus ventricosus]|uniref:Uncharacterized protein n=1 Tax=Araneus ventricosus TaxID=182803 RepID=A0A4Y2C3D4_ARAVE|nr:hypothetical protein AVEN_70269-1 [Araneus ventricosus]
MRVSGEYATGTLNSTAPALASSMVGEGALQEKLSPLCLLPASHGQQITPTCWPCVATHWTGGTFWSLVYQSAGIPAAWLVCLRGSSERVILWGLALRVVNAPGDDPDRIGPG